MNAKVARAIGWNLPYRFIAAPRPYTADDLLTWIMEHTETSEAEIDVVKWGVPASRVTVYPDATRGTHYHGPTLLEALEAAVLAVHEATQ